MEYQAEADIPGDVDEFTRGYLECAEWCGLLDGDDIEGGRAAFDAYDDVPRWGDKALATAREDCADFQQANAADLANVDASQAGHDFYLTRNRHGAGFWDGDYPEDIGRRLTDAAHVYGSADVWFNAEEGTLNFE